MKDAAISTMTLEFVVDVKPDLARVAAVVRRPFGSFDNLTSSDLHWRGRGFSLPKRHRSVCIRGAAFGESCLCLDVGDAAASASQQKPWEEHVCHAKVFNTGHIKLMGCTTYAMADAAVDKLLAILGEASMGPVRVTSSSTQLINAVFGMPPFARDVEVIEKCKLTNLAHSAGFFVHSGATDGKPYVKLILKGTKALVYTSGKVWVTGCKSVHELGSAAQCVQSFIDAHAEQLLSD
ncbi:hypothetical protein OEZ85_011044 [Tetradesmus obliquus]|uniref:Uncharacterized protein n=1 Tax=Tetradesmus obliquus TaxID=3088 RepID=A0ABY8TTR9_TETOB|nr:hypothetical protein OEZ85_011044 [Tetradesmus obliquus]